MQPFEGTTIDRYLIAAPLGRGGMAVVYRAYDTRLERDVAVKLIRTDAIPAEQHAHLIARFEREAKAMSKLSHPNIVSVHDYGEHQGAPYLVMDYQPGGTLKNYTGKQIPYQQAAALLAPIADALAYAHSHHIIHRDVKPSNILITASNNVMLTDFGIAKILEYQDVSLTGTGYGVGTPQYMAPEQWKNHITPSVDIYALGVIFYELITGRRPYDAETPPAIAILQATEPLERPGKFVPDLPEAVEKVIFKALAFQPENRYLSMQDLQTVLLKIAHGQPLPAVLPLPERWQAAPTKREPTLGEGTTFDVLAPAPDHNRTAIAAPRVSRESGKKNDFPWGWLVLGMVCLLGLGGLLVGAYTLWGRSNPAPRTNPPTQAVAFEAALPTATATESIAPAPAEVEQPTATEQVPTATPQPSATAPLGIGSSMRRDKDGMEMMYIPAGEFSMGSDGSDSNAKANEKPQHTVNLDAYWMDKVEVSNAMFATFVDATGYVTGAENWGYGYKYDQSGRWAAYDGLSWRYPINAGTRYQDDLPVIQVNYYDAAAYCQWAGARLPTEAEWEKAARGTDGRLYAWGNSLDTAKANYNNNNGPVSVYSYPSGASPYGLLNMTGNVFEWTSDWFAADAYANSPYANPTGPASGEWRVLRSGSWKSAPVYVRVTNRDVSPPEYMNYILGFRCVMDAAQP